MERQFKITVNGNVYDVIVDDLAAPSSPSNQLMPNYIAMNASAPVLAAAPAAPKQASPAPAAGGGDQGAQMGGVVASVLVKEGQSVNEGEKIMELEAMKMKMPVIANRSGKVSKILVNVGDAVSAGQALLTIA